LVPLLEEAYSALVVALQAAVAAFLALAPEEVCLVLLPEGRVAVQASSAAQVPLAAEEASLAALAPLAAEEAFSAAPALPALEEAFLAAQVLRAVGEACLAARVPQAVEEAFLAALVLRAVGEASSEVLPVVEGAVFLELLHHKVEVCSAGQLPLEDLAWVHPPVVACLVQPHLEVAWVASQMPRRRNLFAWSSPEGWRSSIQSLAELLETDRVLPWLLHRVAECGCLLATSWHTAILFQPIFKLLRRPTIHRHSTQCSMWIK